LNWSVQHFGPNLVELVRPHLVELSVPRCLIKPVLVETLNPIFDWTSLGWNVKSNFD